ncbi:hypothetical protein DIPPA_13362 [Diplonema papillatum]|nr:hypothetical protein DIPPA_13362 [Diplonema papillatum]
MSFDDARDFEGGELTLATALRAKMEGKAGFVFDKFEPQEIQTGGDAEKDKEYLMRISIDGERCAHVHIGQLHAADAIVDDVQIKPVSVTL